MTNLVLCRKAGQSVRLMIGDKPVYVELLQVTPGTCAIVQYPEGRLTNVRFKGTLHITDDVRVTVVDINKGHVKLNFSAPRDVHILRTELIKETV